MLFINIIIYENFMRISKRIRNSTFFLFCKFIQRSQQTTYKMTFIMFLRRTPIYQKAPIDLNLNLARLVLQHLSEANSIIEHKIIRFDE